MTNKKLEDIKPFMIDCTGFSKGQVVEIFDKMVEAGIPVYDSVEAGISVYDSVYVSGGDKGMGYFYNEYPYWGYDGDAKGTYTNSKSAFKANLTITIDQLDNHLGLTSSIPTQELRNVKIDLRNEDGTIDEDLSKAFQEAVFASGGYWIGRVVNFVEYLSKSFLYVDKQGALNYGNEQDTFEQHPYTQITFTYERKLEWAATVVEQEPERAIIELPSGDKYYADELQAALGMIKKIS